VLLPFPAARGRIKPVTMWRSTWVVSSIQTLRHRGYYDRYSALVPDEHRDAILMCVAGTWLPVMVARAHYEACEALGMSRADQVANGVAVGERAQGTVLGTVTRMATGAGVTPWTIVPHMQRLWERGADGGGNCVTRIGPKEGTIETVGCALFDVPYFRAAFGGVVLGIVRMFAREAYVHDQTPQYARGECVLRLQWA
jgi:hypothetical protein